MPLRAAKKLLSRSGTQPASGAIVRTGDGTSKALRLSWVWTTHSHPDCNLGDALSPVVVSALCGLPVQRAAFGANMERLAAVGTIGHALHSGRVHLWGTGFDMARDRTGNLIGYSIPDDTQFVVHAVRGKRTADALRKKGLVVPENYGDPVWFLPKIFPGPTSKTHELGVIVHISELETPTAESVVKATLERYRVPDELVSSIKIINTYTPATIEGLQRKVDEIVSCRRILSTSLHGLVIAETYGIPCAWFPTYNEAPGPFQIDGGNPIDHRMKDFYSGVDRDYVLSFPQPLSLNTDWPTAMRFIDENWQALTYTGERLFNAFPLKPKVRFADEQWRSPAGLLEQIPL